MEVVFSTLIVGVMVVGALESVGMVYRIRRTTIDYSTGPSLARELIAEILSLPYEDPQNPGGAIGVDATETAGVRSTFDDVDDYHNLNEPNARDRAGTLIAGFTGWRRQASVVRATVAVPSTTSATESGLKNISVTVTSPTGRQTAIRSLKSRYGVLEQKLPIEAEAVTWVGAELQLGASTRAERAAATVVNHADQVN